MYLRARPLDRKNLMRTWKDRAQDLGVFIVVSGLFWGPALNLGMKDYAIQHHAVVATHSAVVTYTIKHQRVEFTTNTGRRVDASLGNWLSSSHVELGQVIRVKYVRDKPEQAYLVTYQPRYTGAIFMGSCFLVIAAAFGWSMKSQRKVRIADAAAEKLSAETPLPPRWKPSRKERRRMRQKHPSRPRSSGGGFVRSKSSNRHP
jgi:hypothetical protein